MKKISILTTLVAAVILVSAFSSKKKEGTYKSAQLNSIYANSINELSLEEKQDAFEYYTLTGNCSFKGIQLNGKVKFVTSFPDIKIQYVTSFPDIKVKHVTSFPDDCGEWQVVESFPDFEVQVVTSFPDLKVQLVESFPGMN